MGEAQRISREGCLSDKPAVDNGRLRHRCDTLPGNSGSPVIDPEQRSAIALHHAGSSRNSINYAIPISRIAARSKLVGELAKNSFPVARPKSQDAGQLKQLRERLTTLEEQLRKERSKPKPIDDGNSDAMKAMRERLALLEDEVKTARKESQETNETEEMQALRKQLADLETELNESRKLEIAKPEPSTSTKPYSLDLLAAKVRDSVEKARRNSKIAKGKSQSARSKAAEARRVSKSARRGRGMWAGKVRGGVGIYRGQLRKNNYHWLGFFKHLTTKESGNAYFGQFAGGRYHGLGVFKFGNNPSNTGEVASYHGQVSDGCWSGYGVVKWKNGATYSGSVSNGRMSGSGLSSWKDGMKYEGQYSGGQRSGYGVMWNSDGSISQSGYWRNNDLERVVTKSEN